jgi:hypothetical protein
VILGLIFLISTLSEIQTIVSTERSNAVYWYLLAGLHYTALTTLTAPNSFQGKQWQITIMFTSMTRKTRATRTK